MKTPITCPVCEDSACETKSLQCGTSHAEGEVTASCTPEVAEFIDPTGTLRKSGLLVVEA